MREEWALGRVERSLEGLIRVGRVSSVNVDRHTAQVKLEDDGAQAVSYDLQVLVTRPGDYSLPPADALVVCLLVPGPSGDGYVLGAIYSEADAAPTNDADRRIVSGPVNSATVIFENDGVVEVNGDDHPLPKWDDFEAELKQLLSDLNQALQLGTAGSPAKQQLVGAATIAAKIVAFNAKIDAATFDSTKAKNG